MMAAKAYEFYNAELADSGLAVRVPETINNVTKNEIPLWLDSMGGHAVVKVPYSNAGMVQVYCGDVAISYVYRTWVLIHFVRL